MGLLRPVELVVFIDEFIDSVDLNGSFSWIGVLLGAVNFNSVEVIELLLITIGQIPVKT